MTIRRALEAAAKVCEDHAALCLGISGRNGEKARTAATCAELIRALDPASLEPERDNALAQRLEELATWLDQLADTWRYVYGADHPHMQEEEGARQWAKKLRALDLTALRGEGKGGFDMTAHLRRQRDWSERTFGPGARTAGVVDHIRKELLEIEGDPADIAEWIDVVILALDGAWRAGHSPEQIVTALQAKQAKNEARKWPDWRTMPQDKAIEHDRLAAVPEPAAEGRGEPLPGRD